MPTVVHVIDDLSIGGAQRLVVNLAAASRGSAYRMVVCSLQRCDDFSKNLRQLGIETEVFGRPRPSILHPIRWVRYVVASIRDICRLCRDPDTVALHCHLSDAALLGIAAGRLCKVRRVLVTVHTPRLVPIRWRHDPRNLVRKLFSCFMFRQADHVIAVSSETAEVLTRDYGVPAARITEVATGVELDAAHKERPERLPAVFSGEKPGPVLLFAARLAPPKGHVHLLDAMALLVRADPEIRLLCAGDGPLREELEAKRDALGLGGNVFFLGNRADVADLLAFADVVVFPSLWEGTPLALLEAMAAAKPIVASDIPGIRDVLVDGQNAVLVPPADPRALADGVLGLLGDARRAAALGAEARALIADHYSIDAIFRQHVALWMD